VRLRARGRLPRRNSGRDGVPPAYRLHLTL
jgi:hypothetical protein